MTETTVISPDIRQAIYHMKEKIKNSIYEEWCDTLIACQNDRNLKDTLMPVVSRLTDVRLVNNQLKTMLSEARREYFTIHSEISITLRELSSNEIQWQKQAQAYTRSRRRESRE